MTNEHSDKILKLWVTELCDGNRDAFNSLYRFYSKALLLNIKSLLRNEQDAQEILQDTFLKIWEIRAKLDPERSFKGLLYRIARNLVYNHLRNWAFDVKKKSELFKDQAEGYTHVEEQIIYKENEVLVNAAICQLSEQCQKVFRLSKLDGKSHMEISKLLKISMATVNNHIVKGNNQVRKYLIEHSEILPSFFTLLLTYLTIK